MSDIVLNGNRERFSLEFNASGFNGGWGDVDIANILRNTAEYVSRGVTRGPIKDKYGVLVGRWEWV